MAEIQRRLDRMPEITRRPSAVCAAGDPHACEMFGVTWWQADGSYGAYSVCLTHRLVGGPVGLLAHQLPVPQGAPLSEQPEQPKRGRGLVLLPRTKDIVWALADGGSVLAEGIEPLPTAAQEVSWRDLGVAAGAWLHQLLLTHRPWAVLIIGEIGINDSAPGHKRLTSIGIEVRTTYIDTPLNGYRDILRNERIRGALQGVAYVHAQGRVYTAPVLRIAEGSSLDSRFGSDLDTSEAFSAAASALAKLVQERDGLPEGLS